MDILASPSKLKSGTIFVPGDKSCSQRAIILASVADGDTTIDNFLFAGDPEATLNALRLVGVKYTITKWGCLIIHGKGLKGLGLDINNQERVVLDLGNSGTGMRLLAGVLAAQNFRVTLTGDSSLISRPQARIITPLSLMGCDISGVSSDNDITAPLELNPVPSLNAITYKLPVASAQVKSSILLAGLYAKGSTEIIEPECVRNHTELMLKNFGVNVVENICVQDKKTKSIIINPVDKLNSCEILIPGDISSAAFFIVAALINKNTRLSIMNVGLNPTRIGLLKVLELIGADISINNVTTISNEVVGSIVVNSSNLNGTEVPASLISLCIDEIPIIAVAAAFARGDTLIPNLSELKYKESNRLEAIVLGLNNIGVRVSRIEDGIIIHGCGGIVKGGVVNSFSDHRIAMSFIIAGTASTHGVHVKDCDNINTSFPNFINLLKELSIDCKVI